MNKISPCFWFDGHAEEAMNFYVSVFKDAKVNNVMRYGEAGPGKPGSVLSVTFEIFGQSFTALNASPAFNFTPAISFFVSCEDQEEIDGYWDKLSEGGKISRCGWLDDKFGVSWQIVPANLSQLLQPKDPQKAKRAMQAMLQMTKLDIKTLEEA